MDSHFNYLRLDCHFIFALRASANYEGIEMISALRVIYSSTVFRIMKGVDLEKGRRS